MLAVINYSAMEINQHSLFNQLKKTDSDRAFLLFFAPKQLQSAFVVIDLWNAELMDQLCMITEPHMAMIRLQWWKDQLAQVAQSSVFSDVAMIQQLKELMARFSLTTQDFIAVLDGIADGLAVDEGTDAPSFARYLLAHQGGLLRLKAKMIGVEDQALKVIEALGAVYGLMRGVYSLSAPHAQINVRGIFRDYFLTGSRADLAKTLKRKMDEILNHISRHDQLSFGERRVVLKNSDIIFQNWVHKKAGKKYFCALQTLANLYDQEILRANYSPQDFKPILFKELKIWWQS